MTYFNTTHLTGETLTQARRQTLRQEDAVLATYKAAGRPLTPSEALALSGLRAPLTSIRRAITDLTEAGKLEKTTVQRIGPFGRPEYVWQLSRGQLPLFN